MPRHPLELSSLPKHDSLAHSLCAKPQLLISQGQLGGPRAPFLQRQKDLPHDVAQLSCSHPATRQLLSHLVSLALNSPFSLWRYLKFASVEVHHY